ncbi:MAG: fumarylacetoacetase [Phycisphaerae bacterium]|nr:fumarylacetoacetase [Phycisphaerae bacterium]
MPYAIDETHDPKLTSWVESANDPQSDFPIQNLPWCQVLRDDEDESLQTGVRIGSCVVILDELDEAGMLEGTGWIYGADVEVISELDPADRNVIRKRLSQLLSADCADLRDNSDLRERAVIEFRGDVSEQGDILMLPVFPHDYTDFYASINHATNVGSMFRPDNPLLPNYKHIPIGYHGRASSIVPSGTHIKRPIGQQAPAEDGGSPAFGPCKLLDYEMEMGAIIGRGNELGDHVTIEEAEDHILGLCILNDWSARDLQKWEYVPLGPFLAKNFASTVSPYIVTMEALAPFRCPVAERAEGDPQPLPYMFNEQNQKQGGFDITLEVWIASEKMREQGMEPIRLSKGNFRDMYWTIAQMVTHHTVNGCNLNPGDLLGSGTVSGTTRDSRGSLLELTWDGDPFAEPPVLVPGTQRTPIKLPTGEERKFIADGDEIIMKAYCEREGYWRIGFGECRGIIEPARANT